MGDAAEVTQQPSPGEHPFCPPGCSGAPPRSGSDHLRFSQRFQPRSGNGVGLALGQSSSPCLAVVPVAGARRPEDRDVSRSCRSRRRTMRRPPTSRARQPAPRADSPTSIVAWTSWMWNFLFSHSSAFLYSRVSEPMRLQPPRDPHRYTPTSTTRSAPLKSFGAAYTSTWTLPSIWSVEVNRPSNFSTLVGSDPSMPAESLAIEHAGGGIPIGIEVRERDVWRVHGAQVVERERRRRIRDVATEEPPQGPGADRNGRRGGRRRGGRGGGGRRAGRRRGTLVVVVVVALAGSDVVGVAASDVGGGTAPSPDVVVVTAPNRARSSRWIPNRARPVECSERRVLRRARRIRPPVRRLASESSTATPADDSGSGAVVAVLKRAVPSPLSSRTHRVRGRREVSGLGPVGRCLDHSHGVDGLDRR